MGIKAGVVGFGPVGQNICRCINELCLECDEVRVMACHERVAHLDGEKILVHGLGEGFSEDKLKLFEDLDVVFLSGREGEKGAAKTWGMAALDSGFKCFMIDNGGDFRMDPRFPLVVPEINMDEVSAQTKFVASPNCSTIQMCIALAPLHAVAPIKRVVVTTFQSVSGYGRDGQSELKRQLECCRVDELGCQEFDYDCTVFRKPIVLDCLPHIDAFLDNGYTKEEMKMLYETRKIFGSDEIELCATTVRVPVEIGHAESINVEFAGEMDAATALELWRAARDSHGIVVIDDEARRDPNWPTPKEPEGSYNGHDVAHERTYPTQRDVRSDQYKNLVLVGRTRDDYTAPNAINFWCVADNLRKGAATNVVQIGQELVKRGLIGG